MNIGFFDSGIGAKLIADDFHDHFPEYNICVLNDSKNVPYGNKDDETLIGLFTEKVIELFHHDCKLVIVACNTLSVKLVHRLQDTLIAEQFPDRRLLGIVIPTIEIISESPEQSFLILATVGTVVSQRYQDECKHRCPDKIVHVVPISDLATLLESGNITAGEVLIKTVVEKSLQEYPSQVVALCCTHYILLAEYLRKTFPSVRVISQEEIITPKLHDYLTRHPEIEEKLTKNGEMNYL